MTILRFRFERDHVKAPTKAHPNDAGWDLYWGTTRTPGGALLRPHGIMILDLGLSVAIPHGCVGLICPRSGLATKGITIINSPGIIDSTYRGPLKVILGNIGAEEYIIAPGDRVAQLLVLPIEGITLMGITEPWPTTDRGTGGLGSTGR